MMGVIEPEYRLPMSPMQPKNREILRATLKQCGVLRHD
jgi:dihydrodipicolinate synthase/N-acetylneuraminate lyase